VTLSRSRLSPSNADREAPAGGRSINAWVPKSEVTRFIPADRIFARHMRALGGTVSHLATQRAPIAAAIIVENGKVLLVRRRVAEGELSWQFPAGEVEPGETPENAAVRKACEETDLTVGAMKRLGERVHTATGRTMVYVACDVLAGTAQVPTRRS
jgi:NUDIX domain